MYFLLPKITSNLKYRRNTRGLHLKQHFALKNKQSKDHNKSGIRSITLLFVLLFVILRYIFLLSVVATSQFLNFSIDVKENFKISFVWNDKVKDCLLLKWHFTFCISELLHIKLSITVFSDSKV